MDLISIGECMVELSRQSDGRFSLACGGDTFNTAVYAARLGLSVSYATALGDDPYSDTIMQCAVSETVSVKTVPRLPGRVPGLYIIETDERGERRFFYWRDAAPARSLFELPQAEAMLADLKEAKIIYFSGITLSLYSPQGLDRFERALKDARQAGVRIAFDGNYRPRGWSGDDDRARSVFSRFLRHADLALPTFDDEQMLWGDASPQETWARLHSQGVSEAAIKLGAEGAVTFGKDGAETVAVPERVNPIDTTAAGDSFNAGYLAARRQGLSARQSAHLGHRLASIVIQHRGAIVPKEATQSLALTTALP